MIIKLYEECKLEPQLKPEFVQDIEGTLKKGKFVKVKDLPKNLTEVISSNKRLIYIVCIRKFEG